MKHQFITKKNAQLPGLTSIKEKASHMILYNEQRGNGRFIRQLFRRVKHKCEIVC